MSHNVPASFQVSYRNHVVMALQQHRSKLVGAVTVGHEAGSEKVKVDDIIGNTAANEADERHGDTKYNNPNYDGVWLPKKNELYFADLIDNADKLATAIDLQGTAVMSGAGTVSRAKDQRILEGFYGDIISGKEGTVVTPFPGGNVVPVTEGAAAASKMNTAKIRAATKMLTQAYVDLEMHERYMVLTADDNDALLTEIPATSADFKASYKGEVNDDGQVMRLLGWRFLHMELDNPLLGPVPDLATDGSGYRKTPFWVKAGLVANFWQELRTDVSPVPTKQLSTQVWAGTTLAATRTQAGMSGQILNVKG